MRRRINQLGYIFTLVKAPQLASSVKYDVTRQHDGAWLFTNTSEKELKSLHLLAQSHVSKYIELGPVMFLPLLQLECVGTFFISQPEFSSSGFSFIFSFWCDDTDEELRLFFTEHFSPTALELKYKCKQAKLPLNVSTPYGSLLTQSYCQGNFTLH